MCFKSYLQVGREWEEVLTHNLRLSLALLSRSTRSPLLRMGAKDDCLNVEGPSTELRLRSLRVGLGSWVLQEGDGNNPPSPVINSFH